MAEGEITIHITGLFVMYFSCRPATAHFLQCICNGLLICASLPPHITGTLNAMCENNAERYAPKVAYFLLKYWRRL